MEQHIENLEALERFAAAFVRDLAPREDSATLVTLSGELGAGKTAFVKAAAMALGVEDIVNSPTFVLEKIYALPAPAAGAGFKRLIHVDAYRLEQGSDLAPLGFDEAMKSSENLIMLEWPERVADALPPAALALTLTPLPDGSRRLQVQ